MLARPRKKHTQRAIISTELHMVLEANEKEGNGISEPAGARWNLSVRHSPADGNEIAPLLKAKR